MGSKSWLLQTLVANSGANAVPTQGLNWRMGCPPDPRVVAFQDGRKPIEQDATFRIWHISLRHCVPPYIVPNCGQI